MNWLCGVFVGMVPCQVGTALLDCRTWLENDALDGTVQASAVHVVPLLPWLEFMVSVVSPDQPHGTCPTGTGMEAQLLGVTLPPEVTLAGVQPLGKA